MPGDKTVIIDGITRIVLPGFPYGTPSLNQRVMTNAGPAVCTGRVESSDHLELWEVELTVVDQSAVG